MKPIYSTPEKVTKLLEDAYVYALQTDGKLRINNQDLLCELRDELARRHGITDKLCQETYESRAVKIKYSL